MGCRVQRACCNKVGIMERPSVQIVATGIANTASLQAAFRRLGVESVLIDDPELVASERLVVLPGVGAFGAGMERLRSSGLGEAICERISAGKPLLSVCLGLQLLFRSSEESPDVAGLGIFNAPVTRFSTRERIPQLGWNRVEAPTQARYLTSGYAYFANSFCVRDLSGVDAVATAEYGHPFVAAFEHGGLLACQFHPELSGAHGAGLLQRWIEQAE